MARFQITISKTTLSRESNCTNQILYCFGIRENQSSKTCQATNILESSGNLYPELKIFYGHFLTHMVYAPLAQPTEKIKTVKIIKTEEKGSDVNLAVHLLNDAWLDNYDCAIIVSNDSDLAESMKLVRQYHKEKTLGLIMPGKGHPSKELMKHADFVKRIRSGVLAASQLPNPIPKTNIYKPLDW